MTDIGNGHTLITVTSFEAAMRLLGGPARVSDITDSSRSCVWNWRKAKQFPARHYRVICHELQLVDATPDIRLFRFKQPSRRKRKVLIADAVAA